MNAIDLVDDVTQQIAADHAVLHAAEDVGNNLALTAFLAAAGHTAQVREQARAARAVGTVAFILVDESQQFVATEAVLAGGPITPAVGPVDDGMIGLTIQFGFFLIHHFEVVEELEKHHPGEQGETVHIAVQPLVFAQDLAGTANKCRQVIAGRERRFDPFCSWFVFSCEPFRKFSSLIKGRLQA